MSKSFDEQIHELELKDYTDINQYLMDSETDPDGFNEKFEVEKIYDLRSHVSGLSFLNSDNFDFPDVLSEYHIYCDENYYIYFIKYKSLDQDECVVAGSQVKRLYDLMMGLFRANNMIYNQPALSKAKVTKLS